MFVDEATTPFPSLSLLSTCSLRILSSPHLPSQFACLACVTAAIAIALVGFQALSDSVHAQLGLAIFILTALQPILALMRPKKGSALRVLWFSSHLLFGMAALALGWWNCVTGLQLYGEDWGSDTQVRGESGWV